MDAPEPAPPEPPYPRQPLPSYPPDSPARPESFLLSLVSAGLFLYVGFILNLAGISGNAIYDGSVTAFTWGARIVGIGILVTALMSLARVPGAALLDMLVSMLAAAGCLAVGVIWMVYSDMEGVLVLLFGILNTSAARAAWQRWRLLRAAATLAQQHTVREPLSANAGATAADLPGARQQADDDSASTVAPLLRSKLKNRTPEN